MGAYLYKVVAKPVGQLNGEPVYPAQYGYKPYGGDDKENHKLAFRTGVLRAEATWERAGLGGKDVLVAHLGESGRGAVYRIKRCYGSVLDDSVRGFDQPPVVRDWGPEDDTNERESA
jgi:hypothetical protein